MNSKTSQLFKYFGAFFCLLIFSGCGESVPPGKINYVGEWNGPGMYLSISQSGSVNYERQKGGSETTINGPLKGFEGDDFSVGISFLSTTFVVSKPPYNEDGVWKMVVDGVELTRD